MPYKIGQTYYRLTENLDLESSRTQPWKIVAIRVVGESRDLVEILNTESTVGRSVSVRKPWLAYVSPWDAVDDKLAVCDREIKAARDEAERQARAAQSKIDQLVADRKLLLDFRSNIDPETA